MKRRFFSILTGFLFALSSFLLIAEPAQAQITKAWGEECYTGIQYRGAELNAATLQGFECLVANVLATATSFIGLAAFIMIIFGAFLYLTSGGNSSGIETAKKSITYGIIGIIVALLAFFVLVLLADFTGVSIIKEFNITIN
jgi:hypothetical protein